MGLLAAIAGRGQDVLVLEVGLDLVPPSVLAGCSKGDERLETARVDGVPEEEESAIVIIRVHLQGNADLTLVREAGGALGGHLRAGKDGEKDRRKVSRTELIGIMRPRVEEILEEVRGVLDAAGFDQLPSQQIVLTGGASQIPGLDMLAARILGQNVRLGRPLRVQGLPQAATGPSFSSTVGLCLFAAHPQDEWWDFEIPAERYPARSLRRAMKWFKDNW